ncbi:MAG TPA: N,N-dimethylformamidase beta subunit family domain-containing protein, partial [Candidatus Dormibacteraeota bacterium]|nr:N,N-dimethylformamidase beta subunit family domain-containing protein [Candidatus Dormibacteraeota bacterium]
MWQSKHTNSLSSVFFNGVRLFAALGVALLSYASAWAQSNPILVENQQTGTTQWQIPVGTEATDVEGQIKGYASATSVNKGENITFYVTTNPAQTYTIDVFRMGWYQGLGGRLMQHIGPLNGVPQPTCPTDPTTGMIECHWSPAYTLATQTSWTSGIYLALLTNSNNYRNYIEFVVRDDSRVAALLYQQAVATTEAYNDYPYDNKTGKSLYPFNSFGATTVSGGPNAVKVSFDRPYNGDGTMSINSQSFLYWEYPFVRWMEMSGYDVTYATDIDAHNNGGMLLNYRGLLSVAHDEYWSKPMYDAWIAALNAGVNLGFFGADALDWQVRFEPSTSGVPNRVVVCYRNASIDPVTDPTLTTVKWRDPPLNRPQQTLMGVQYTNQVKWNGAYAPYVVQNSGNWVYAGTGFRDGDTVPGIVGYEADRQYGTYPLPNAIAGTYTLLSSSPFTSSSSTSDYANSSVYQAPSGAWVFGAGTVQWSWALDNFSSVVNLVDARIQQTTANILNRFVAPVGGSFTITASPSSQTVTPGGSTSYSVTINPTGGFGGQVNLSVSGVPSGATGSFAPNPATATSTLSVTTGTGTP